MKLFVDKVSSYEGVETPTPSVQQTGVLEKGIDDPIEFDAKKFMESISDLLSKSTFVVHIMLFSLRFCFFNGRAICQPVVFSTQGYLRCEISRGISIYMNSSWSCFDLFKYIMIIVV